jgi:hypothetical protein
VTLRHEAAVVFRDEVLLEFKEERPVAGRAAHHQDESIVSLRQPRHQHAVGDVGGFADEGGVVALVTAKADVVDGDTGKVVTWVMQAVKESQPVLLCDLLTRQNKS